MKTLQDWLDFCERLHPVSIDMGLERVREVADRLALRFECPVITVAGTNGKGSTCAMLEAILLQAGYRTGVYTSPHLVHFEERCRLRGEICQAADLVPHFEKMLYDQAMLMLACRYDIQYKKIKPALEEGCIVLSDRSFISMLAYQLMYTGKSDHQQIRRFIELSTYVVRRPDRVLMFDLPTSVALERCDSPPFSPVGWTNAEYLEQVRKSYLRMMHWGMIENAVPVDALKDPGQVFLDLKKIIDADVEAYRLRILERAKKGA